MTTPEPEHKARTTTKSVLVAAAFSQKADAEAAVCELGRAGFGQGSISLVFTDPSTLAPEGLWAGAVFGGVVGLVGLLFLPVGLLVAAGPIVGALAAALSTWRNAVPWAGAGAAIGGIGSGLVALGMPHQMADRFGQHVRRGDALIIVHCSTAEAPRVREILEAHAPRATEASA